MLDNVSRASVANEDDAAAVYAAEVLIAALSRASPMVQSHVFIAMNEARSEAGACSHCFYVTERPCHCWNDE